MEQMVLLRLMFVFVTLLDVFCLGLIVSNQSKFIHSLKSKWARLQQQQQHQHQQHCIKNRRTRATTISKKNTVSMMAVTPIGPFCPFRSSAAVEMQPRMETLNTATPEFATEMTRIRLDMETGQTPNPDQLRRVAQDMEDAVDEWENLLTRFRISSDFQTKEYAKLTEAHLKRHDQTSGAIASMMRWQANCMRSMAENKPPPPPPSDIDVVKMMQEAQQQQQKQQQQQDDDEDGGARGGGPPSIAAMKAAEQITATPFKGTESAFESPRVKLEYEQLCRDHASLIDMGGTYADFDPLGKIAFLDEVDKIQDRWDVFFARFSLLGQLNHDFVNQCDRFLSSMGLNEMEFRELLKETHRLMREDANQERNFMN